MHVDSDEKTKGYHMPDYVRFKHLYVPQETSICSQCKKHSRPLSKTRGTSLGMCGQGGDVNFGQVGTDSRVSQRAVHPSIVRETHVRVVFDAESL